MFKIIFLDKAGYHLTKALRIPANIHLLYLPSSNPDRTADAGESCRTLLARSGANAYEKAVASLNFKDEAEPEVWIQQTIHAYTEALNVVVRQYLIITNFNHPKSRIKRSGSSFIFGEPRISL